MNSEPTYNLLNSINYPEDLRKLTVEQLPEVCGELRQDIIKELCCNPGHFAASLGTVELTVALHYVYNTPYDRIVWDVGHQAYGHKILTGRREAFSTNRKLGGIRPFPSPEESVDHGTGVVIGETCVIGNNVKLYQGVTLGAKSFPLDADGKPIKGIPRHPILEDNVIVYSNATILGRITIGQGATVGGNIWVTEDVPAGARIVQTKAKK